MRIFLSFMLNACCSLTISSWYVVLDTGWNAWRVWSGCDKSCGGGIQVRTRTCDGFRCPGSAQEIKTCHTFSCRTGEYGILFTLMFSKCR